MTARHATQCGYEHRSPDQELVCLELTASRRVGLFRRPQMPADYPPSMRAPLASSAPVRRLSPLMHDGQHKDATFFHPVHDGVRKSRHRVSPIPCPKGCARFGKLRDPFAGSFDALQESSTHPVAALFLEAGSFDHLGRGAAVEINQLHRNASRARWNAAAAGSATVGDATTSW